MDGTTASAHRNVFAAELNMGAVFGKKEIMYRSRCDLYKEEFFKRPQFFYRKALMKFQST